MANTVGSPTNALSMGKMQIGNKNAIRTDINPIELPLTLSAHACFMGVDSLGLEKSTIGP
jgi:hypothetical protein